MPGIEANPFYAAPRFIRLRGSIDLQRDAQHWFTCAGVWAEKSSLLEWSVPSFAKSAARGKASAKVAPATLDLLDNHTERLIACQRCPRLRAYCTTIAETKRRAYLDHQYWGKPVPSFGDPSARLLILGLAPGAHGSNRTGRPFTGDGSGNFLYPVLYEAGFASQPESTSASDGLRLHDAWITSVVRCAPPDNKPSIEEQRNCAPWLDEELALLEKLQVVVCLGRIAWDGFRAHLHRTRPTATRTTYTFSHGAEYTLADGRTLIGSYHPSLQNTNTGRLTRAMFLDIFRRARAAMS